MRKNNFLSTLPFAILSFFGYFRHALEIIFAKRKLFPKRKLFLLLIFAKKYFATQNIFLQKYRRK